MKSAPESTPRRYILAGYLIAAVFAITYVSLLAFGGYLHPALATVTSASLLAVVLAAPLVLPVIAQHVLPRMTAIKIPDIVKISLAEVSSSGGPSLNAMVDQLAISAKHASAPEYASMMSSQSAVIVETVRNLGIAGSDVLIVDLRRGPAGGLRGNAGGGRDLRLRVRAPGTGRGAHRGVSGPRGGGQAR
jgi:hypothetical protein